MKRLDKFFVAGIALMLAPSGMLAQTEWDEAEQAIVRIPVDGFADLPLQIRSALTSIECLVPQAWGTDSVHNVISGSFAQLGQTDWAALCSVNGSSAIFVVWGGAASCSSPVSPPLADRKFLQQTGVDGILFSRGISRIRPDPAYWSFPETMTIDSITHHAIDDAFYEKGAIAYYCHHGSWLEFQTSD